MNKIFFKLNYDKCGGIISTSTCEEYETYIIQEDYDLEKEKFTKSLEKVLKIMQEQDVNKYRSVYFYIGKTDSFHTEKFTRFVISQTWNQRENKVYEVITYEAINSRNTELLSKREVKKRVMEYWNQLEDE